MNADLLREREAFKKKASAVVYDKPAKRPNLTEKKEKKEKDKSLANTSSAKAKLDLAQLKQMGGSSSSQFKFGVLTKIVKHMKNRHMDGEDQPLTLEQLLDETNQLDVGTKTKMWLETEALKNNPKISASANSNRDGLSTYLFKPPFDIVNRKGLLKLLKHYNIKGKGGILLDDLQESLPKCEKHINTLEDNNDIWIVTRKVDKKKVVFYHDNNDDFVVHDDFARLWRSVPVMDELKIDEYLEKQGITSMQDQGLKAALKRKPVKRKVNRKRRALKDNVHVEGLVDYNDLTAEAHSK